MSTYWDERGNPWEHDPGPPKNRRWAGLFADTPNYRALSKKSLHREKFRWHFGPMFYRGRLRDNRVKMLIIGQEGAQDESLAHRSFTGGTGARMQYFLAHLGIDYSYLFLNTFVYPIRGQYDSSIETLAQSPDSPIAAHRQEIFDYVLERNDLRLVVAVGKAAKQSVVSWVRSHGGDCPNGSQQVSTCDGSSLGPRVKIVGVPHPGGAAMGGASAVIEGFRQAVSKIATWIEDEPDWLPLDPGMTRDLSEPYRYRSRPIPFRDFPFGAPMRLGRGGTSSNRRDRQRSIQIFSAGGRYNARGARLDYDDECEGDPVGYRAKPRDLPYEPAKEDERDFDSGPSAGLGRRLMGGLPGAPWPDFESMELPAHPSLGTGAIYRGRAEDAVVWILADQQSHDDLFTGRALTGDCGQHLQALLNAMGIDRHYFILRSLPVDTLSVSRATLRRVVRSPEVVAVYQEIVDFAFGSSPPQMVITMGLRREGAFRPLERPGVSGRRAEASARFGCALRLARKAATYRDVAVRSRHCSTHIRL